MKKMTSAKAVQAATENQNAKGLSLRDARHIFKPILPVSTQ
ncbi:MAG: hypothetical protein WBR15_05950 [Gammaproteobacteria bacterium]